jgi:hypothetical protein
VRSPATAATKKRETQHRRQRSGCFRSRGPRDRPGLSQDKLRSTRLIQRSYREVTRHPGGPPMKLNEPAYAHAKSLIEDRRVVLDQRDDWSEHQPSAQDENRYIQQHGMAEYARWSPPLRRARCRIACRPVQVLRHRERGSAPARDARCADGRVGRELRRPPLGDDRMPGRSGLADRRSIMREGVSRGCPPARDPRSPPLECDTRGRARSSSPGAA